MKNIVKLCFSAATGLVVFFTGCKVDSTSYYVALRRQSEGNMAEAKRLFLKTAKNGSSFVSRLCLEELTAFGNVKERLQACENLVNSFKDENSMMIAVRQYFDADEYAKIISLTNGLNLETADNSLIYLRLESLKRKTDSRFFDEIKTWFTTRAISAEHYRLYCDSVKDGTLKSMADFLAIADFRTDVYTRNYKAAFQSFSEAREMLPMIPQIVSDMGKVCLYGSDAFYKNAMTFDSMAKQLTGRDSEYYAFFYAARLYEKAGNYFSYASKRYKSAMECAKKDEHYDNALWYLLNLELKRSTERGIECVKKYCSTWKNPSYFDDFFDTLTPIMLSEGRWDSFLSLYKALDGNATDEVVSKLAYIYGRLVQEKLAMPVLTDTHGSEDDAAFTRALTSGNEPYYKVMAIYRLGYAGETELDVLCNNKVEADYAIDTEAEEILLNYAAYGLPEKIYPFWQRLRRENKNIGYETGMKIARFLYECGENRNEFYPQSLRIAVKVVEKSNKPVDIEDLKLVYPRDYSWIISEKCKKYEIPEEIMYALVRSESYFASDAGSSAGAKGLAQLMSATAADVARRIKYGEYDLTKPEDNLEFGTWYIANLYSRLDHLWMPSFFAYNVGITPVRRWQKSAIIEFNNIKKLPDDIFLETIPYSETRQYGRKLASASAMYAWLYYNKTIGEAIGEIIK